MPLSTQIERDGSLLKLHWGDFHVASMVIAAAIDSGKGPFKENTIDGVLGHPARDYDIAQTPLAISGSTSFTLTSYPVIGSTPLNNGQYVLQHDYKFIDMMDGEVLELHAGDVLRAWR